MQTQPASTDGRPRGSPHESGGHPPSSRPACGGGVWGPGLSESPVTHTVSYHCRWGWRRLCGVDVDAACELLGPLVHRYFQDTSATTYALHFFQEKVNKLLSFFAYKLSSPTMVLTLIIVPREIIPTCVCLVRCSVAEGHEHTACNNAVVYYITRVAKSTYEASTTLSTSTPSMSLLIPLFPPPNIGRCAGRGILCRSWKPGLSNNNNNNNGRQDEFLGLLAATACPAGFMIHQYKWPTLLFQ